MAKMKLIFTEYQENWDNFTVHVVVKATLNDVPLEGISLDMSHKRATTAVIHRAVADQVMDVVQQAIKRLGMQPTDYDHDLQSMLKEFDVFLHQDFRDQCAEYEIPYKHLIA